MSVRPKPRPRPKPKAATGPSTSDAAPDTDEMFMRNTSRGMNTWKQLEQKNREIKSRASDDDDDDEEESPRKKGKKKKKDTAPSWQKNGTRIFSTEISDHDSDDDIVFMGIENTPNKKRKRPERERSRSRSITPPPELPAHALQNTRNIVREALARKPRAESPTQYDDYNDVSNDSFILDPELDRIARRAKASFKPSSSLARQDSSTATIEIKVKWQPHPLNLQAKSDTTVFKMNRNDAFRELFEAVADQESIPVESLVMTYRNMRLFPSVTPINLDIYGSAEFMSCNKTTYEYLRAQSMLPKQIKLVPESSNDPDGAVVIVSDDEDDFGGGGPPRFESIAPDTDHEDDGPDDKFKLHFKSKLTSGEITLTVRPATTCGAIVKGFLKKAGLADKYPHVMNGTAPPPPRRNAGPPPDPRLCIDGDKMENDTEIGEMELEDGDMVDVVGL